MIEATSLRWQAPWVWFEISLAQNRYMMARRSFQLSSRPCVCSLAISADSHYKLHVNGRFIQRGPVRSIAGHFYYDMVDVTEYLQVGSNVIAVLAHQRFWRQGRLLVQGSVDVKGAAPILLDTDIACWRVSPARAWNTDVRAATAGPEVGFQEVVDLRELPEHWLEPGFNDSTWAAPIVVGEAALDAAANNLSLRDIPPLSEQLVGEASVFVRACAMSSLPDAYSLDLASMSGVTEYLGVGILAEEDVTVQFTGVGDGDLAVFLDGVCLSFRPKDTTEKARPLPLRLTRGSHFLALRIGKGIWTWTTTYAITPNQSVRFSPASGNASDLLDHWRVIPNRVKKNDWPVPMQIVPELELGEGEAASGPIVKAHLDVAQRMTWEQVIKDLPIPSGFPLEVPRQMPGETTSVIVDLGKECVGFPILELTSGEASTVVDVGYGEFLADGLVPVAHYVNHFADRVILRQGHQIFEPSFWWKGCRYLQLHFRNTTGPLTVHRLNFRECRYPVEPVGHFECSDTILNEIWRVGVRTLQCCMGDAYMDCPSREQKDYLGDGVPQIHATYQAFGDTLLATNLLRQYVRRQKPSGFFGEGPGNILDQNLDFIVIVRLCYLFTGQREILREFYEPSRKLMQAFARHLNADGLLQNLSGSCWIDHELWDYHDADRSGVRTRLDLRFYQALRDFTYVATEFGHKADARESQMTADRVRDGILGVLWDPQRHLFIDGSKGGKLLSSISIHVNYLALLYEVAPRDEWEPMFKAMIDPALHAARAFSPFFHYYIHRALFKIEKPERVLDYLQEIWGGFLRMGLTTFPEGLVPTTDSRCHAYSCTPNVDLMSDIIGLFPLEPGFRVFGFRPRLTLLADASASLPTPHGFIQVNWKTLSEFTELHLSVPPGTQALFKQGDLEQLLFPGDHLKRFTAEGRLISG